MEDITRMEDNWQEEQDKVPEKRIIKKLEDDWGEVEKRPEDPGRLNLSSTESPEQPTGLG